MITQPRQPLPLRLFRTLRDQVLSVGPKAMLQAGLYPLRKTYHKGRLAGGQAPRFRGVLAVLAKLYRILLGREEHLPETLSAPLSPGQVLEYTVLAQSEPWQVILHCEHAWIQIAVLESDLIRTRIRPKDSKGDPTSYPPPFSYAVVWPENGGRSPKVEVQDEPEALWVRTPRLQCRIDRAKTTMAFFDPDGILIHADAAACSWDMTGRTVHCTKMLLPDEHFYGLGQKTTRLDKRGLAFEMWNRDPPYYRPNDDPIYSNIPFYMGLLDRHTESGQAYGYGLFVDHTSPSQFDFGKENLERTQIEHESNPDGDLHRSYFFYGPDLYTVLDRYTELTGRPTMLPLWALGYHQNRWSYASAPRVRKIAHEFRTRRIPCDALHLDIDYMDGFRSFTWHPERFPDPGGLVADLHSQGFQVVTMIDPGIKVDPQYWVYQEGKARRAFLTYPDGTPYGGPVWPGECRFPDFTSPAVRSWWGSLYKDLIELGIDGFWNDMNEPAVFGPSGDTIPDIVRHAWEGQGTDHRTAHNTYGMLMARASTQGVCDLRPNERPLVISRSVWAGSQRYNVHWLGDNYADWDSLRNVPQLVMNMGLSGLGFTGPDTGGFIGTPSPELLIRWNQLSTFTPFFRNHTAKTTADQEPWALGPECERISRATIELRYRLLPYLYTALWQSTQTGIPIMRPLCMVFQDDPTCLAGDEGFSIDDQFMVGDALLVAPVTEPGKRSRQVYLPPGTWIEFWQDKPLLGPMTLEIEAPLDQIPLFVRSGSIVPMWPVMQFTGERRADPLMLHIYPGTGQSTLYQDDGHTWAFREGAYRVTQWTCELEGDLALEALLQIRRSVYGTYRPSETQVEIILHGCNRPPSRVMVDGSYAEPASSWKPGNYAYRLPNPDSKTLQIHYVAGSSSSSSLPSTQTGIRC